MKSIHLKRCVMSLRERDDIQKHRRKRVSELREIEAHTKIILER